MELLLYSALELLCVCCHHALSFTPVCNCVELAPALLCSCALVLLCSNLCSCAPACFPLHLCAAPALLCSQLCFQLCFTPVFNFFLRACHTSIQSRHQTLISSQFTNFYPESSLQPYLQLLHLNQTPFTLYKNGFSAS